MDAGAIKAVKRANQLLAELERENASWLFKLANGETAQPKDPDYFLHLCDTETRVLEEIECKLTEMEVTFIANPDDEDEIEVALEYLEKEGKVVMEVEMQNARVVGQERGERLKKSYYDFKINQEFLNEERRSKIRADLGIAKALARLADKEALVEKLTLDLRTKEVILERKRDEGRLPAEVVRKKYEQEFAEDKLVKLTNVVAFNKEEISRLTAIQMEHDDKLFSTKQKLAILLFEMQKEIHERAAAEEAAEIASTTTITNDASPVPSKTKAPSVPTPQLRFGQGGVTLKSAREELNKSLDDIQQAICEGVVLSDAVVAAERKGAFLRDTSNTQRKSPESQALDRLKAFCRKTEEQIQNEKDRSAEIEKELLLKKEIKIDSREGNELLFRLMARKKRREELKAKAVLKRIEIALPAAKVEAIEHEIVEHVIMPSQFTTAKHTSELLKECSKSSTDGVDKHFFHEANRNSCKIKRPSGQTPFVDYHNDLGDVAALNSSRRALAAIRSLREEESLLEDYGLQAVAEQLFVLEDLLGDNTAPKIHAMLLARKKSGVEELRNSIQDVSDRIVQTYHDITDTEQSILLLESDVVSLKEVRDELRGAFLAEIAGRDGMPLTTSSRREEVNLNCDAISDLRRELDAMKINVMLKRSELERLRIQKQEADERQRIYGFASDVDDTIDAPTTSERTSSTPECTTMAAAQPNKLDSVCAVDDNGNAAALLPSPTSHHLSDKKSSSEQAINVVHDVVATQENVSCAEHVPLTKEAEVLEPILFPFEADTEDFTASQLEVLKEIINMTKVKQEEERLEAAAAAAEEEERRKAEAEDKAAAAAAEEDLDVYAYVPTFHVETLTEEKAQMLASLYYAEETRQHQRSVIEKLEKVVPIEVVELELERELDTPVEKSPAPRPQIFYSYEATTDRKQRPETVKTTAVPPSLSVSTYGSSYVVTANDELIINVSKRRRRKEKKQDRLNHVVLVTGTGYSSAIPVSPYLFPKRKYHPRYLVASPEKDVQVNAASLGTSRFYKYQQHQVDAGLLLSPLPNLIANNEEWQKGKRKAIESDDDSDDDGESEFAFKLRFD